MISSESTYVKNRPGGMSGYGQTLKPLLLVTLVLFSTDLIGGVKVRVGIGVNINASPNKGNTICKNYDHPFGNLTNGAFFCPERSQPEHYTYCCGDSGQQRCCGFYDDPSRAGWAIFGYICAGIPVAIFACALIVWCCAYFISKIKG